MNLLSLVEGAVSVVQDEEGFVFRDKDNEILTPPSQAEIEAEVGRLQAEYDALQYQRDRQYPSIGDQLDMIFKEIKANGSISANGEWVTTIQSVKDQVPKPDDSTQPA